MMENTNNSKPWIKPGWNKKRDDTLTPYQIRHILSKIVTDKELKRIYASLTDREKMDVIYKYFAPPKESIIESKGSAVQILINIPDAKEVEGQVIEDDKALEAHHSDANDD